jgi:Acetoacetate decarboxylase (ADC)
MKDFFFDVPRTSVMTTEGRVDLPMFFYDMSARFLNYFVDHGRAARLLEGTGLEPVRFFNGKAMVNLAFMQYREVSIGGYDEVFVTIMCYPKMLPAPRLPFTNMLKSSGAGWTIGGYVLEMPVTIPWARVAGREIWGYPKFETQIPNRLAGRHFEFGVLDPETREPLLRVSGEETPGLKMPGVDMVSFGNHDGKILRTVTETDGLLKNCKVRDLRVEVSGGDHRLARNVRDLGLAEIKPWGAMSGDAIRSKLNPGVPTADWETPPMPYRVEGEKWAEPIEATI